MKLLDKNNLIFARSRVVIFLILTFCILTIDQVSKHWARTTLEDNPKFIGDTKIGFALAYNSGSAFSLFENSTIYITIIATLVVTILIYLAFSTKRFSMSLAYVLIAVGAFGNIIDRITQYPYRGHGAVTDFIKIGSWPTFNIADSAISIGAFILIISSFIGERKNEQ